MNTESAGFTQIGDSLHEVVKEVVCRAKLCPRLEAKIGRPLTDEDGYRYGQTQTKPLMLGRAEGKGNSGFHARSMAALRRRSREG